MHITEVARSKVNRMVTHVDKVDLSKGVRSKPLVGLPIRRIIPQDVHSLLDYANGTAGLMAAGYANTERARLVNTTLSTAAVGVSLFTNYKLSLAKIIPIEIHEVIDYAWGVSNIVAPFALGYYRKDRLVSWAQIGLGLGTIAASLFTDYRAFRGTRSGGHSRQQRRPTMTTKKRRKA